MSALATGTDEPAGRRPALHLVSSLPLQYPLYFLVALIGVVILVQWGGAASGQRGAELGELSRSAGELAARAQALERALAQLPAADAAAHGLPACGSCDCTPPPVLVIRETPNAATCDCPAASLKPRDEPEEPLRANDPRLCVVVRTDSRSANSHLRPMLHSLLVHRPANLRVVLIDPDAADRAAVLPRLQAIAEEMNTLMGAPYVQHHSVLQTSQNCRAVSISSLTQAAAAQAWPNVSADHGYLLVDAQLELLLNATADEYLNATRKSDDYLCDYVMFTAATNIYLARFVPLFTRAMRNGTGLVGCDFVSPFFITEGLGYKPGLDISKYGRNQQYFASFSVGHMDLGAMMIQAKALRQTGIRFCVDQLRQQQASGCEFVADGLISQRLISANVSSHIISEVLFVKQQLG